MEPCNSRNAFPTFKIVKLYCSTFKTMNEVTSLFKRFQGLFTLLILYIGAWPYLFPTMRTTVIGTISMPIIFYNINNLFLYYHYHPQQNFSYFHSLRGTKWSFDHREYMQQLKTYLRESSDTHFLKTIAKTCNPQFSCALLITWILQEQKSMTLWSLTVAQHPANLALSNIRYCQILFPGPLLSPPIHCCLSILIRDPLWFLFILSLEL